MSICFEVFGISSVVCVGADKCYIVPNNVSSIFVADLKSWNIHWKCDIPWKYPFFAVDMIERNGVIWCVARKGLQIAGYDLQSNSVSMYIGKDIDRDNLISMLYKDDIYIFPKDLPGEVVRFSITEKTYHNLTKWNAEMKNLKVQDHLLAYVVEGGKVAATLKTGKGIIIFDIRKQFTYIKLIEVQDTFFGITAVENGYYLTSYNKKRVSYFNTITNEIVFWDNKNKRGFYHQIFKIENSFLLSGMTGLEILQNGNFYSIITVPEGIKENIGSAYIFAQMVGSKVFLWPWNADKLLEINKFTFQYKEHSFNMSLCDYAHVFSIMFERNLSLNDYNHAIVQYEINENDYPETVNKGIEIFRYIREEK